MNKVCRYLVLWTDHVYNYKLYIRQPPSNTVTYRLPHTSEENVSVGRCPNKSVVITYRLPYASEEIKNNVRAGTALEYLFYLLPPFLRSHRRTAHGGNACGNK